VLMIACLMGMRSAGARRGTPSIPARGSSTIERDKEELVRIKRDTEEQLKWSRQTISKPESSREKIQGQPQN